MTPEMATMLSQAGCRAQHRAWHGRSRACPPGFIPCPKTLLGLGLGQWQSQGGGWGCPAVRQGWGPWGTGSTNNRRASSSSARPSHDQSPPGRCGRWPGLPHCRETYGVIAWAGLGAQWPRCSAWGGRDGSAQGGGGLSPIHLHARPLGEGEHPAAPQFWGTSPLPHGSCIRGTSPLPYLPWFGGDFPAAPDAVTGVGMFPLSHIPWLGGDFPAAPCPIAWWGCPCCPMSHDSGGMSPPPHIPRLGGNIPAA